LLQPACIMMQASNLRNVAGLRKAACEMVVWLT